MTHVSNLLLFNFVMYSAFFPFQWNFTFFSYFLSYKKQQNSDKQWWNQSLKFKWEKQKISAFLIRLIGTKTISLQFITIKSKTTIINPQLQPPLSKLKTHYWSLNIFCSFPFLWILLTQDSSFDMKVNTFLTHLSSLSHQSSTTKT